MGFRPKLPRPTGELCRFEQTRDSARTSAELVARLTTAAGFESWLGSELKVDARPGGKIRYRDDKGQSRVGAFATIQPPKIIEMVLDELGSFSVSLKDGKSGCTVSVIAQVVLPNSEAATWQQTIEALVRKLI